MRSAKDTGDYCTNGMGDEYSCPPPVHLFDRDRSQLGVEIRLHDGQSERGLPFDGAIELVNHIRTRAEPVLHLPEQSSSQSERTGFEKAVRGEMEDTVSYGTNTPTHIDPLNASSKLANTFVHKYPDKPIV